MTQRDFDHRAYAVHRGALCAAAALVAIFGAGTAGAQIIVPDDAPWADDAAVKQVLEVRKIGLDAMIAGNMTAENQSLSSTFVVNTPNNTVVPGDVILGMFQTGDIQYDRVEQRLEYAGSHGPDTVVLMGEEIVVPGAGLANAGEPIRRRFTDVFRRENGEWRHDLRHSHIVED